MIKSKRIIALLLSVLITLTMVMPTVVFADDSYTALLLNREALVSLSEGEYSANTVTFTPSEDGEYQFEFSAPYEFGVAIYESADFMEMPIAVGGGYGFSTKAYLSKDVTYYINVNSYGETTDAFDVYAFVKEAPTVEKVEIVELPEQIEAYEGTLDNIYFWGLCFKILLSDGSETYVYNGEYYDGFFIDYYVETNKKSKDYGKVTITVDEKSTSFKLKILENPVSKIEYVGEGVTYIEGTFCGEEYDENDKPYYYYYFDEKIYKQGDVFKITYKDGTTRKARVWETVENGYSLECYSDQYENHWTTKSKNYAIVSYLGHEVKVPVKIVKSPVKSIKIDKAPSYVYTYGEAEYGYMEDDVYYMWPTNFEGLKFTVTYKDGSKRSFVGEDIDEYRGQLEGEEFAVDFMYDEVKIGKNKVAVSYCGAEASYDVTVKKSNIKSIKLTKEPKTKTYSDYFYPDFEGAEFTVTYNDKTKKVIKITKENMVVNGHVTRIFDGDTYLGNIFPEYQEDGIKFQLAYFDKYCDIDCMKYRDDYYDKIEVKNVNKDFKDVEVVAYNSNGKKETYKLKNDFESDMGGYGGMDIIPFEFYTDTDKGILNAQCEIYIKDGIPTTYAVRTLGCYWEKEVNAKAKLQSIAVDRMPNKVKFAKGEKFDAEGLVLSLDYGKGLVGNIEYGMADITLSKVDTKTLGKKTVTVTYGGKKTTFEIEVTDGFADVKKGIWYQEFVDYAAQYGIFAGTDEVKNTFSPDMTMTRAQIVQIFANIEGINTDNSNVDAGFKDVKKGQWYTAAVKWAAENGIVTGTGDGNFKPNDAVTREQLCVMVENYINSYAGGYFEKKVAGTPFKDDAQISSWAKEAVYKCQRAGIISGTGDGKFAPLATANRAQGATIFAQFHKDYLN